MPILYIAMVLAAVSCAASDARNAPHGSEELDSVESLVERMESDTDETAHTFGRLRVQRERAICALLRVAVPPAEDVTSRIRKGRAMELLGEYRARDACQFLVRQLDFSAPGVRSEIDPLNAYPAAKAILRIGEPGIGMIIVGSAPLETDDQFQLAAYVLKRYYQPEDDVGLFRMRCVLKQMQDARGEAACPSGKEEKLERLIETYQSIDLKNPKHEPSPRRRVQP